MAKIFWGQNKYSCNKQRIFRQKITSSISDMKLYTELLINIDCLIFINTPLMEKALKIINNKIDKSILLSLQEKSYFSLIWLHGLGDSPYGFLDFFQMKNSPVYVGARIKLLHAPIRPVTINGGAMYSSWYDIKSLSNQGAKQQNNFSIDQVKESLSIIDKHVDGEISYWKERGIKDTEEKIRKRIFVGGFSQGAAMSLCYALNSEKLLGGVIGFSGHLFESFPLKNKSKIPMLVYHGDEDEVLYYALVKPGYDKHLKGLPNFRFSLIKGMGHSVVNDELSESTAWILDNLKSNQIMP